MSRSRLSLAVASILALNAGAAHAALTLDTTFDTDGIATVDFANNLDGARGIAVQSDQKIVLVGMSRQSSGGNTFDYLALTRLNTDGTLDATFGTSGRVTSLPAGTSNFGGADGRAVAIQSDGSIVVAGTYNDNTGGGKRLLVARYSSAGVLDTTFGTNGYAIVGSGGNTPAVAEAIAIQSDGRIVVAGRAEPNSDYFRGVVVRLEANGAVDTAFATGGVYTLSAAASFQHVSFRTLDVLSTGHIVAGGTDGNLLIVKLNSAGALDTTFDVDGMASVNIGTIAIGGGATANTDDGIEGLSVLGDGSLLVTGTATTNAAGNAYRPIVARFTSNGALDTTYGTNGYVPTFPAAMSANVPYDIVALTSGEAVIAGLQFQPAQIAADGSAVSQLTGSTGQQAALRLARQSDGKVVGAGETNVSGANYSMSAFRLNVTALTGGTPPDTTPNAFSFVDQTGVALSSQIVSAPITITGITAAAAVSISGGEYSVGCGATYTTVAGTINNGQTICVRHTSSASNSTAVSTTLTMGGVSDTFTSTTLAAVTPPAPAPAPSTPPSSGGGAMGWLFGMSLLLLLRRRGVGV